MISTWRSPFTARHLPPVSHRPIAPLTASDEATFIRLALAGDDALVLFGAAWCRPGQRASEHVRHVAGRRQLAALTVDVDGSPKLVRRYGVTAIPSLLLFHGGQEVARRIGEVGEHDLEDWVALALG
jgi:thioredoxin-like negative regulator of GroEL